jgi:hypothetical protein
MESLGYFRTSRILFSIFLASVVVGMPFAAMGATVSCNWQRGGPHKMHWAQCPDEGFTGTDIALGRTVLADDFKCTATGPIRDIHIWGSFLNDALPKGGPGSLTLELIIYSDVPATGKAPSQPGEVLWLKTFAPGEYATLKVHNGPQDWYDPASALYLPNNDRDTYQYDFCILKDPFAQEEGKIYWLAVKDASTAGDYSFGWRSTAGRFRWNDDAVYLPPVANARWVEMTYPNDHKYAQESLDLAFAITDGGAGIGSRDLGDAPDSSNTVAGATMTAYPGVTANFPTVYLAASPPYGPMHQLPRDMFYLGKWVSLEIDADVGLDDDTVNNLDPLNDVANRDGGDDGLKLPVAMPFCGQTTFDYTVTVTGTAVRQAYVNVWCDWNRDGDWDDAVTCADGTTVPEWAVQNQAITLSGLGTYAYTTPSFRCWHPTKDATDPIWVRISIAETKWQAPAGGAAVGGTGPAAGYKYGETEDYYIRSVDDATRLTYDWGDAPESAAAPGYPTLAASNGARHVIAGPWLGDAGDRPDIESDGKPDPNALGDDLTGSDDENGACIPPLVQGEAADITIQVNGGGGVVQAWIDFNADRTWQASEKIFDGFLPDGVHVLSFSVPKDAAIGQTFARFRISRQGGLSPAGVAPDGEVEDYQVWIHPSDPPKKWCQWPDTTPHGVDVRVDSRDNRVRVVADDFQCSEPGALTHIRLWGSWRDDRKGEIEKIRLRIYADDPAGPGGTDTKNKYSKPDPAVLWDRSFTTGEFSEMLYHEVCIAGEWWWDPVLNEGTAGGDGQIWQIDMTVDAGSAFVQEGTPDNPRIYWLSVQVDANDGQFGWKTRRWPDHFMDDAVWDVEDARAAWRELYYPHGNQHYDVESNSLDMAFCLLFEGGGTHVTSQPTAVTQCSMVETECPITLTQCPIVETRCPTGDTYCPVAQTRCPPVSTQCPSVETQCPVTPTKCPPSVTQCQVVQTECPAVETRCPVVETQCPVTETQCPASDTQCPPVSTSCPPVFTQCPATPTKCQAVDTQCPSVDTRCPPVDTQCPVTDTQCPVADTRCPAAPTSCPPVSTSCPPVFTQCPPTPTKCQAVDTQCPSVDTRCPPVDTQCPETETQCPASDTQCPPVSTSCPPVYTQCPATPSVCTTVPTQCPSVDTRCPPVDTQCPVTDTQCPVADTRCPAAPTSCPPVYTQCPATPSVCTTVATQCPLADTQCPVQETQCPTSQTQCPAYETRCPPTPTQCTATQCPVPTQCPPVSTECPVAQTQCPAILSECPPSPTQCPSPTTCPPAPTQCPPTLSACIKCGPGEPSWAVGTTCPIVQADCLTVDDYLMTAER